MIKCLPHIRNGSAQIHLIKSEYLQAHGHHCADFSCTEDLNAHEGLGRKVKDGERQNRRWMVR